MSDPLSPAFLERCLRADVDQLTDPTALEVVGLPDLAYAALERAGLLRRVGAIPADLEAALGEERTLGAAIEAMLDLTLEARLDALLEEPDELEHEDEGGEGAGGADGHEDPFASPERVDATETLFLDRDRVQAAVGEVARRLPAARALRSRLATVVARLAAFDARYRRAMAEFLSAAPLARRLAPLMAVERLDPATHWWWAALEEEARRAESPPPLAESLARALEEDRCAADLVDPGAQAAAFASGEPFPGDRAFRRHLPRCPSCRRAVDELAALFGPAQGAAPRAARGGFALAAAPTEAEALEELQAASFRPKAPVPGTRFQVAVGLREADRLRLTFHEQGQAGRTRALDGGLVRIEGVGEARVEDGAAEVAHPEGRASPAAALRALEARRVLIAADGTEIALP